MIFGIGNDIIEVKRIAQAIDRHGNRFLDRIYTTDEQEYCLHHRESARHFAGRFAAKEAIVKALGTGIGHVAAWTDIEIKNDPSGKPVAFISPHVLEALSVKGKLTVRVSISHCHEYATAFALCEVD